MLCLNHKKRSFSRLGLKWEKKTCLRKLESYCHRDLEKKKYSTILIVVLLFHVGFLSCHQRFLRFSLASYLNKHCDVAVGAAGLSGAATAAVTSAGAAAGYLASFFRR